MGQGARVYLSILIFLMFDPFPPVDAAETYCLPQQPDFAEICAKNLTGIVDGGRCIFGVPVKSIDWASAWAICKSYGAALAQFHTLSERMRFQKFVADAYPKFNSTSGCPHCTILMAYYDEMGLATTGDCFASSSAHWYDDVNSYQPLLTKNNTLAKYYDCLQDLNMEATGPRCYSMQYKDDPCATGYYNYGFYPACFISNQAQSYNRSGACLGETVIESVLGATADECATECSARSGWCRSYNFMYYGDGNNNNRCDMFPRSVLDCDSDPTMCPMRTGETASCIHYNYIP